MLRLNDYPLTKAALKQIMEEDRLYFDELDNFDKEMVVRAYFIDRVRMNEIDFLCVNDLKNELVNMYDKSENIKDNLKVIFEDELDELYEMAHHDRFGDTYPFMSEYEKEVRSSVKTLTRNEMKSYN